MPQSRSKVGVDRTERRKRIAAGVVARKSVTEIARSEGISKQSVSIAIQNPETQSLIQSMLAPHHNTLRRLVPRALAAVNSSLKPSQATVDRLRGVKTLGYMMELAEAGAARNGPSPGAAGGRFNGDLEALLVLYSRISAAPESGPPGAA